MKSEKRQFQKWEYVETSTPSEKKKPLNLRLLLVLLWLILMGGISHSVMAQCDALVFNSPDVGSANELSVGDDCTVTFNPDLVLENPSSCPEDKMISVFVDGDLLGSGLNEVDIDLSAEIGKIIRVVIEVQTDPVITGESYLRVVDTKAPTLDCPPNYVTGEEGQLECIADTSLAALGMATVMDNCDPNLTVTFSDIVETGDCDDDYVRRITRRFRTVDANDSVATCEQIIEFRRPTADEIDFPSDVVLSCDDAIATPDSTGFPTLPSLTDTSIMIMNPCDLLIEYEDDTTYSCNKVSMTIIRTWTVSSKCAPTMKETHEQVIDIVDETDPIITCPEDFTVGMIPGECEAAVLLPEPLELTDNCDPNVTYFVNTSFGRMGLGPHVGLRKGTHTLQYTAIDACGNTTSCMTTLTVEDQETPTAVCDDELIISLTDGGVAIAKAVSFDEGSSDNCVTNLYYKARRMDTGSCDALNGDDDLEEEGVQEYFDDWVFFCCEDLDELQDSVIMRVFEVNPGRGPVHPDRMNGDGDLVDTYNECMALVTIQDKIPPRITCPPNDTIDCKDNRTDLARFGSPIVIETCGFTLDSTSLVETEQCGLGMITRTFTATDNQGLSSSCTQTIYIENNDELVDTMITWPMDVDTVLCGGPSLEPDDLPAGFDRPVVDFNGCGAITIGKTDDRFDPLEEGGCYKILRTWTVMDWCRDKAFTYRQEIKVSDNVAPTITCPVSEIVTGVSPGTCNSARVDMPIPTATDNCTAPVTIYHESSFADNSGADASGVYPLGTTTVRFYATDNCGNVDRCDVRIIVEDDVAPSPQCLVGVVAPLAEVDDDVILASVEADIFVPSDIVDPCDPDGDFDLFIRRGDGSSLTPPTTTELTFTCADIGFVNVEIWATDAQGNAGVCATRVEVQDNNSLCTGGGMTAQGVIAGQIETQDGNSVEDVLVSVQQDNPFAITTDVAGGFMVNDVPFGADVTIIPRKTDELLNGVTTMDMILIQKQILGLNQIQSPYSLIAADIDNSGGISTLDLIRLRRIVLNKDQEFPAGNTSWRFIDADYEFPEGSNPLQMDFPELKNVQDFSEARRDVRFIAVKVGDVNNSVQPNSVMKSEGRSTNGDVVLDVMDREFEAGETFTVDVSSRDLFNLIGLQFTLDYDERLIELLDFEAGNLPRMTDQNFGLTDVDQGIITASWNEDNDVLTMDEGTLVRLTFRAIRSGDLFTALELKSDPTLAEAYNYNQDAMQILLRFRDEQGQTKLNSGFKLYQNYPNPFNETTKIGFVLPTRMDVRLSVFDMAGRIVLRQQANYDKGYNELQLSSQDLPNHGLYYYTIETDEHTVTRKMIFATSR